MASLVCWGCEQITIASTMVGMVEGMLYAQRAGLDVPTYDTEPPKACATDGCCVVSSACCKDPSPCLEVPPAQSCLHK